MISNLSEGSSFFEMKKRPCYECVWITGGIIGGRKARRCTGSSDKRSCQKRKKKQLKGEKRMGRGARGGGRRHGSNLTKVTRNNYRKKRAVVRRQAAKAVKGP